MPRVSKLPSIVLSLLTSSLALAAPKHDICADLGPTLPVGISSFSVAGDWPVVAEQQYGVDWKFLYVYVLPTNDPPTAVESFLLGKATLARSLGAIPVYTFYELLTLGQQAGLSGSEPDIVKAVLADPALMKRYFDNFVFMLRIAAQAGEPTIVHVEPDSWGFMMWAMGVEGNADATSVRVAVTSSGHPDVAGFSNDAAGFGKALLALRDRYAPSVRLGWHASNFRVGQHPEVVTGFYSSLGEWDVLFTEQPHLEAPAGWWEPLDPTLLDTNVTWFSRVSAAAHVPIILWQAQIGTTDYHFFGGDPTVLQRFAAAGLGAVLFDLRGSGNPDDFRAVESAALAAVPPASSGAGGTAADMRTRLAAYSKNPLAWPAGSPCAVAGAGGTGDSGGSSTPDAGAASDAPVASGTADAPAVPGAADGPAAAGRADGAIDAGVADGVAAGGRATAPKGTGDEVTSGCSVASGGQGARSWLLLVAIVMAWSRRSRRRGPAT